MEFVYCREDDVIPIAPGIEVKIVAVGTEKVRLGITAPRDVAIHRAELLPRVLAERSVEEKLAAAAAPVVDLGGEGG